MEREFQMRGHTGGLAVKDIPVIVLITGVVRGIGSFLVGGGDDLALCGRGNGDFSREGLVLWSALMYTPRAVLVWPA